MARKRHRKKGRLDREDDVEQEHEQGDLLDGIEEAAPDGAAEAEEEPGEVRPDAPGEPGPGDEAPRPGTPSFQPIPSREGEPPGHGSEEETPPEPRDPPADPAHEEAHGDPDVSSEIGNGALCGKVAPTG